MTTSPLPWTVYYDPETEVTQLKDASGDVIASFKDYTDAEYLVECARFDEDTREELETKLGEIKSELEACEKELSQQDTNLEEAERILHVVDDESKTIEEIRTAIESYFASS